LVGKIPMHTDYHNSRFVPDPRRDGLWKALWRFYFSRLITKDDVVLDLGCGYGDFINNVRAKRRIALDSWSDFPNFVESNIETIVAESTDLSAIQNNSINFVFASNLFEHMSQNQLAISLEEISKKLVKGGQLTILQPNFRYCSTEYFDDFTHVSIWSHISLADFLVANGYEMIEIRSRFLPLTIKSRFPVNQFLIGLYLRFPFKPFGKQMLLRARPA